MTRFLRRLFSDEALAAFLRAEGGVEAPPQPAPLPTWDRPEAPAYTPALIREPEFNEPAPLVPRPVPMPEPVRPLTLQPRRVNWVRRLVQHIPAPKIPRLTAAKVAQQFIREQEQGTLRITSFTDCTKILHEFPRS